MSKEKIQVEFFHSPTCPYCPAARRMLYEVSEEYSDIVQIEEIDAWSEEGKPRAMKYDVRLVPSIVINGEKRMEGIPNRQMISKIIVEAANDRR